MPLRWEISRGAWVVDLGACHPHGRSRVRAAQAHVRASAHVARPNVTVVRSEAVVVDAASQMSRLIYVLFDI